jgi:hypothetical protein
MKTENCVYPKCQNKAEMYWGSVRHPKYKKIMAGWCETHHPDKEEVYNYMESATNEKSNVYENRMGLLRYGKKMGWVKK